MAVELKDFIKTVITDITDAVGELQSEVTNGALISPGITKDMAHTYIFNGRDFSPVTNIDFEICVYGETVREEGKGLGVKIKTFIAGVSAKDSDTERNTSKIRFSIPLSLPAAHVKGFPTVTEKRNQDTIPGVFQH